MVTFRNKDPRERNPLAATWEGLLDQVVFRYSRVFSCILQLCGLMGLIYGIQASFRSAFSYGLLWIAAASILIGLGAILYSLTRIIRITEESQNNCEDHVSLLIRNLRPESGSNPPSGQDLEHLGAKLDQAAKLLQDINENTLLDEPGRRRKYEFLALQERRRVFTDIDRLVQDREWRQAKALLEGMLVKYPENPEVLGYLRQLDDLRKHAFNDELAQAKKTITDLIAISAWDRAIRHAETLLEKHPDMPAARELQVHVRAERNRFREDQIKRMYADIQRLIAKKRWSDALQIARQLTDKYPDSVEAESLHDQITTLETNAEIEKRQQLEEQIKDLVRRRNFIQAVELAKYVIETYPTSPQAAALRNQIEKLLELSRQQEKEVQ